MPSVNVKPPIVLLMALVLALGGCASSGTGGPGRRSSTRLTEEDLVNDQSLDLFTIIQRRRPQWLQVRPGVSIANDATVSVIIDGTRQDDGVGILRSIRGAEVQEVEYMNALDATTRYGTDNVAGAIIVTTKRSMALLTAGAACAVRA